MFFDAVATDDTHNVVAERLAESLRFGLDLLGELTGRGEDDTVGTVVAAPFEFIEAGQLSDVD